MVKLASFFMAAACASDFPGVQQDSLTIPLPSPQPAIDPLMMLLLLGKEDVLKEDVLKTDPNLKSQAEYREICAKTDDESGCLLVVDELYDQSGNLINDCNNFLLNANEKANCIAEQDIFIAAINGHIESTNILNNLTGKSLLDNDLFLFMMMGGGAPCIPGAPCGTDMNSLLPLLLLKDGSLSDTDPLLLMMMLNGGFSGTGGMNGMLPLLLLDGGIGSGKGLTAKNLLIMNMMNPANYPIGAPMVDPMILLLLLE